MAWGIDMAWGVLALATVLWRGTLSTRWHRDCFGLCPGYCCDSINMEVLIFSDSSFQ